MTADTHTSAALAWFGLGADGLPGADAVEAYERDGVVSLRHAFAPEWVALIAEGMETAISDAVERDTAFTISAPGEEGVFYYDTFMWKRIEAFRRFAFESPAADIARRVMRSEGLLFYFDFMLVKEPGTSRATPLR